MRRRSETAGLDAFTGAAVRVPGRDGGKGALAGARRKAERPGMRFFLLAAALAAFPPASVAAHDPREPAMTRNPDGSWTIHRPIESEPAPRATLAGGLVEDRRGVSPEEKADEDLREAFEEASDMARDAPPD
jgi:hypothetical protein